MSLEITVFQFLNGLAGLSHFWDRVIIFLAADLLWVMWLLFIVFLVVTYDEVIDPLYKKKRLARNLRELKKMDYNLVGLVFISSGLGFLVNQFIGLLWFRARPFVVLDNVRQLIERSALDKSFPSDHTTLVFVLAIAVFAYNRHWGSWLILLAVVQGIARVISGVHFVSDVLGGLLVSVLAVYLVKPLIRQFSR